MPAPRTPTAKLALRGAFAHDPKRRAARKHEPKPNGPVGEPPSRLRGRERAAWLELVSEAPAQVLTKADRAIVELTARIKAKIDRGEMNAFLAQQLRACLAALGMTPADRSRVSATDTEKPRSPWDEIGGEPN